MYSEGFCNDQELLYFCQVPVSRLSTEHVCQEAVGCSYCCSLSMRGEVEVAEEVGEVAGLELLPFLVKEAVVGAGAGRWQRDRLGRSCWGLLYLSWWLG